MLFIFGKILSCISFADSQFNALCKNLSVSCVCKYSQSHLFLASSNVNHSIIQKFCGCKKGCSIIGILLYFLIISDVFIALNCGDVIIKSIFHEIFSPKLLASKNHFSVS